jgi:hypothetical protein
VNEQNWNSAIDVAGDGAYGLTAGNYLYRIDLATLASTYLPISGLGAGPTGGYCRAQAHVYVAETNELFWLETNNSQQHASQPVDLRATNCATGASRRAVTNLTPLLSAFEYGVTGQLPVVHVPSRRKIYIFYPEFRDRAAWYNGSTEREPGSFGPDGQGLFDGGIYEISFDAGYINPIVTMIPYAQGLKDYAIAMNQPPINPDQRNRAEDVCFFNAWYDAPRDKIYASFNNYWEIFEFGFTS